MIKLISKFFLRWPARCSQFGYDRVVHLLMPKNRDLVLRDLQIMRLSLRGELVQLANELRDPYLFRDLDGSKYLFYVGSGEQAIGVAKSVSRRIDKIGQ